MKLNDAESRAKLEAGRLRDQLSREETTAVALRSEAAEVRKGSHGVVSTERAEEQAELMKNNMSWVGSVAQNLYGALQKQYESMQQVNDNPTSLKPEYLAARDNDRKAPRLGRLSLWDEEEQLRSTCDRLKNHRNELQDELEDMTERYDELVNDQPIALPKFGDVTTPPTGIAPRPRS